MLNCQELIKLRKKVLEKEFSRMNEMQKEAVFSLKGPLLILAGAGSGKTTVVVNRIANMIKYGNAYNSDFINQNITDDNIDEMLDFLNGGVLSDEVREKIADYPVKPWRVMAITFTNKAAKELKERLISMLGEKGNDIWASTFHSSCARILRRFGDRLGFSNHFTIYDMDDSKRLIKECMKDLNISDKNIPVKSVLGEISRAKDSLRTPKEFIDESSNDFRLLQIGKAYNLYQKRLLAADAMDFDDLIVNTVKLFQTNEDVLDFYQSRIEYLMVDEYQDTNHAQYTFVKLLADKRKNICVVGDDDQSIYKFRGATIENIMSFEKNFSNAKVIRLEQNYRSTQNILDAANSVIANNEGRKGKNLWTNNGQGSLVTIYNAYNEQQEADNIAEEILKSVAKGRKYSDFAVLYRMNSQSLTLERMFTKQGIPHRLLGGVRFYDRVEIKDMLAYLSVINNPSDEVRLKRIINKPKRAIGGRTVELVDEIAQQLGLSIFEVIKTADQYPALSKAYKKLMVFGDMMTEFIRYYDEHTINELYLKIIDDTNYVEFLKNDDPDKANDRIENIKELSSNIIRYDEENGEEILTLSDFLEDISLITDIDNYDTSTEAVTMMTIHSAKGLEFPVVFLPGWEEGVFPGNMAIYNEGEVEEDRRLAYVAITRAKEELLIFHANQRMIFGSTSFNPISRFITEIPQDFVENKGEERPKLKSFDSFSNSVKQKPVKLPTFTQPKAVETQTFKEGDRVLHRTFGEGIVTSTRPMGSDTLLEIVFEVGTKMLGANFAKLKKM